MRSTRNDFVEVCIFTLRASVALLVNRQFNFSNIVSVYLRAVFFVVAETLNHFVIIIDIEVQV